MTRSRWPDRVTRGDVTSGVVGDDDEVSVSPSACIDMIDMDMNDKFSNYQSQLDWNSPIFT